MAKGGLIGGLGDGHIVGIPCSGNHFGWCGRMGEMLAAWDFICVLSADT